MIAPKLNKGDAIGVFSPSSPATATARVRYGRGKAYLESIVANKASFPHVLPTPDAWTDEFLDWETQDRAKRPVANALVTVCGGKAEGRLVAGNLNTMEGFWGTRYFPAILEGDILMIEDSMKDASTIERSFAMLKLNGVFERIGGLVLGKHEKFDDRGSGRMPYDILVEVMGDVRFPVLAQFDCCHTHPMLTLPIGSRVGLDADAQRLTILREDDEGI